MSLGKKVKSARLEKNLTQQDVVGSFITRNMLSKIENDAATPSIKTIDYLAQKLDKPISYFLDDSDLAISKEETLGLGLVFEHSCFLIKNKEYMKCIQYIENVLHQQDYSSTTYYHGPVLYNLIVCYMHTKDYSKVNSIYPNAATFLESSGDCFYLCKLYIELSNMCLYNKKIKYCEGLLKKAIYYLDKSFTDNTALKIDLYYKLGCSLMVNKEFSHAAEYLNFALDLSKEYNLFYNSSHIHLKLFIIYNNMLNTSKALYHIKKALVSLEYTENKVELALVLKQASRTCIALNDYNSAMIYLFKCLKCYDENSLPANNLKSSIMLCLLHKRLYQKVINFSHQIDLNNIDHFWKNVFSYSLALANIKLGNLNVAEQRLNEITHFLEDTTFNLSKSPYLKSLAESYTLISDFYSTTKNYEKAYIFLSKANELLKL